MRKGRIVLSMFLIAGVLSFVLAISKAGGSTIYDIYKNGSISIEIPSVATESDTSTDTNVIFSKFFKDEGQGYWGYIQLWKINNLEDFLANSKKYSIFNFLSYNTKKVRIGSLEGLEIEWVAQIQLDRVISAREYFLKKDSSDKVLRLSFFTNEKTFPSKVDEILKTIKWD